MDTAEIANEEISVKEETDIIQESEESCQMLKTSFNVDRASVDELREKVAELCSENEMLQDRLKNVEKIKCEKESESLDYLDRYRRSLAEVENMRRRTQTEKQENLKYANFNIVSDLLVIFDDFDRAIEHGKKDPCETTSFLEGIEMIAMQFGELLFKKYGVVKYGEINDLFDPNIHQAFMMEEGEYEKETIIEVFRKGFMLHDRVIRPAQVKIGKPKITN